MKKKICIVTLGCKVNQYESNSISKALEDRGYIVKNSLDSADCYVLNTCAVTNEAERKSRGYIAKIKKLNEKAPIFVCGCSAQHDPNKFKTYENVMCVYGTSSKFEIVDKIDSYFKLNSREQTISNEISSVYQDKYIAKGERTRAVIKIQEGCNNFCSYCLIPFLRGRERSRELDSVENEVKNTPAKEVVFTGINLSHYGIDFKDKKSLKDVAIMMQKYPQIRFQFSSLEQDIITEDFLKVLSKTKNFCPHFHLSLQSGCDKTLKFMNRKYVASEYYDKIKLIRKYFDNPAITTDIIVGFPTETDEDFTKSYEFAKKCEFAKIHIFPYSVRSNTVAAKLPMVATNDKERVKLLSALDKTMQNNYIKSCQNRFVDMLIETNKNGYYTGHSENYIKCYLKTDKKLESNLIIRVKIVKPYLDGAIVKD